MGVTIMQNIVALLRERNEHLRKFHAANEKGLTEFSAGRFESLDFFYHQREQILGAIKLIEDSLAQLNRNLLPQLEVPLAMRNEASLLLHEKDQLVTTILSQDLQVLGLIENEKSKIIKEMQRVQRGRKIAQAYQSDDPENILDEKA